MYFMAFCNKDFSFLRLTSGVPTPLAAGAQFRQMVQTIYMNRTNFVIEIKIKL